MANKVTGRGRGKPAGNGGNGRKLSTTDNETPEARAARIATEQQQKEEAEAIQLLSVVAAVKGQLGKVAIKKAELKTEQDALNDIFRAAKLQSKDFERGRIMELVEDSNPEARRNIVEREAIRTRFRKAMGLPVAQSEEQLDLESRLPDVEREASFWFQAGYTAGVTGEFCNAPEACVRAGHDNKYAEGHKAGQAVIAMGMASAKATKEKATPPPEETADQRRARERAEEAKAKEGLEGMKAVRGEAPPLDPVQESVKAATEGEFTEATPEELEAQTTRQAVQAAREGDAEPAADNAEAI